MLSSACALAIALALGAGSPQPGALSADRPFHDLVGNLRHDMAALPSTGTALVLGSGAAAALALHPADDDLAAWVHSNGASRYTTVGSVLGGGWLQAGAAVAVYATGVAVHHPTTTHIGSDLVRAQLLNGIVTRGLKVAVDRTRPSGGKHSFPSGHSSAAFTSAAVLGTHFGWKVGVPAFAVASFIGWTRVRDDVHWLSDVIVGSAIGAVVGRTVARAHVSSRWAVTPAASASSVGVFVVRLRE